MCWASRVNVGGSATAVVDARGHVLEHLGRTAPDLLNGETLWDVELMVSEMVTNSVQAAAGKISVGTVLHWDHVSVEVADDAAGWPEPRAASTDQSSGRGLAILAALSRAWGVAETSTGKEVWVVMTLPLGVRTPADCRLRPS